MNNSTKRLKVGIIRLYPFIVNIWEVIVIVLALCGCDCSSLNHILGYSFLSTFCLYLISKSEPLYHCKWNRALYLNLMFVSLVGFVDGMFNILNIDIFLCIITLSWTIAMIYTVIKCFKHFNRNK